MSALCSASLSGHLILQHYLLALSLTVTMIRQRPLVLSYRWGKHEQTLYCCRSSLGSGSSF